MYLSLLASWYINYILASWMQDFSWQQHTWQVIVAQQESVFSWSSIQNRIAQWQVVRNYLVGVYHEYVFLQQPWDFQTDTSLQKFVSPDIGMQQLAYRPTDLVTLSWYTEIQVASSDYKIRKVALYDLRAMAQAFQATFKKPLRIISSYRAYIYQKTLFSWYVQKYGATYAPTISAKPWYSEHQLGLAIDIFAASTAQDFVKEYWSYADWMQQHAHEYWRTQSYQKGKEVDGYIVEPWHYRYVGKELATYLWKKKITFGEFVKVIKPLR